MWVIVAVTIVSFAENCADIAVKKRCNYIIKEIIPTLLPIQTVFLPNNFFIF